MKTQSLLFVFGILTSAQLLVTPVFASDTKPLTGTAFCAAFPTAIHRGDYITETSVTVSKGSTLSMMLNTATTVLSGAPKQLRSIDTSKLNWTSNSLQSHGIGRSPFGAIRVEVSDRLEDFIDIRIETLRGFHLLEASEISLLGNLYPQLLIRSEGKSSLRTDLGQARPEYLSFGLRRSDFPLVTDFQMTARSLLNTLLNDPRNILGGNLADQTSTFEIPKAMRSIPMVRKNADFFGNFAEWTKSDNAEWRAAAVNPGPHGSSYKTVVTVNTESRTMRIWLGNHNRADLVANVRRVLKAAFDSGLDTTLGGLPKSAVSGINGFAIYDLPIRDQSVKFAELLHIFMNAPGFDTPLTNVMGFQAREVGVWQRNQGLNQRDLSGPLIDVGELIDSKTTIVKPTGTEN